MNVHEIQHYLQLLGEELQRRNVTGEIVMAGGAVMLLVIHFPDEQDEFLDEQGEL